MFVSSIGADGVLSVLVCLSGAGGTGVPGVVLVRHLPYDGAAVIRR